MFTVLITKATVLIVEVTVLMLEVTVLGSQKLDAVTVS